MESTTLSQTSLFTMGKAGHSVCAEAWGDTEEPLWMESAALLFYLLSTRTEAARE